MWWLRSAPPGGWARLSAGRSAARGGSGRIRQRVGMLHAIVVLRSVGYVKSCLGTKKATPLGSPSSRVKCARLLSEHAPRHEGTGLTGGRPSAEPDDRVLSHEH